MTAAGQIIAVQGGSRYVVDNRITHLFSGQIIVWAPKRLWLVYDVTVRSKARVF